MYEKIHSLHIYICRDPQIKCYWVPQISYFYHAKMMQLLMQVLIENWALPTLGWIKLYIQHYDARMDSMTCATGTK